MNKLTAEILCVGTEILLGNIVNTNAQYLSKELADIGVEVYYQSVIGDNPLRLKEALRLAYSRVNMVIMTGGLGPTYDDLTKETVAEYFGEKMVMHQESLDYMMEFFKNRGITPTPNNMKQAMMPENAYVLKNDAGTAPGLALEKDGKIAVLMPGPPFEMKAMYKSYVEPWLLKKTDHVLVSRVVHINGIGESAVEYELRDYMESRTNPTIAPYAKQGEVQLRITASAKTREEGLKMIEPMLEDVKAKFGKNVFGIDIGNQESALVKLLLEKKLKISTAESCTGGLVAKRITDIPGSSEVFECGIVSYSNRIKEEILGVDGKSIDEHNVVSAEVAMEMAKKVRRLSSSDISIGITGIAGPGGGDEERPVGLIYIAVDSDKYSEVYRYLPGHGGLGREALRYAASQHALRMALYAAGLY